MEGIGKMSEPILTFDGEFRFLSNFWPVMIVVAGISYRDVETAYQAAKATNPTDHRHVASSRSPGQAKRRGREIAVRGDWERVKVEVMTQLVVKKFKHAHLAALLKATGDREIQEGNTWRDRFWGISPPGSGLGENTLGKILMELRTHL